MGDLACRDWWCKPTLRWDCSFPPCLTLWAAGTKTGREVNGRQHTDDGEVWKVADTKGVITSQETRKGGKLSREWGELCWWKGTITLCSIICSSDSATSLNTAVTKYYLFTQWPIISCARSRSQRAHWVSFCAPTRARAGPESSQHLTWHRGHASCCRYILFHQVLASRSVTAAFSRAGPSSPLAKWLRKWFRYCCKNGGLLPSRLMDVVLPLKHLGTNK